MFEIFEHMHPTVAKCLVPSVQSMVVLVAGPTKMLSDIMVGWKEQQIQGVFCLMSAAAFLQPTVDASCLGFLSAH